jgi:autotransporter-associated beta strand protein
MTGGTLNVGATKGTAATVPVTITTANGGSIRVNTTGNLTVSAVGSTAAKSLNVAGGSLNLSAALTVNGTLTMSGGSITGSSVSATRFSLSAGTINGDLLGTGALTKTGTGTLTLNGAANGYSGTTTVSAGTMVIGSAGRLPAGQALTVNGGTLNLGGTSASLSTVTVSRGAISGGNISATTYSVSGGTISANLGGAALLTKTGTGTAILEGTNNTYTGGTTVSAGTLQVSASSLPGNVFNNAALTFNQLTSDSYDGVINGKGRLTKTGTGTLTLTGANVYTGGTTISAGTLAVSSGTLPPPPGKATIVVNTGATLSFDNSSPSKVDFGAPVSGRGAFVKTGTGEVRLDGANTYTGGTTVSDGVLSGTPRSLRGNITNNGTIAYDTSAFQGTQSGIISGPGGLIKTGAGTLTLTGANSYLGNTVVQAGTLTGSSVSLPGNIVATAGVITFNQAASGTYTGNISGAGSLVKLGAGVLTMTGTSTFLGGTTVSAGTLQGNAANLQGAIVNNATVDFNQPTSGEYAGIMSGRGRLTKTGTGTLTLSGDNIYTGGTTVSAGTLAGTVFSLQGNIVNNAQVQMTEENQATYLGVISGFGGFTKLGAGTLTMTGANTYSGITTVSDGTLAGSTRSLRGTIVNNGAVEFQQTSAGTYAGTMVGSGRLIKTGDGALTLSGANDYLGGTIVSGGSLIGTASSLRGPIVNNTVCVAQSRYFLSSSAPSVQ